MSQLRDDLGYFTACSIEGNDHVKFVQPRQCHHRIAAGNPLLLQQQLIAGISLNDARRRQLHRQLSAPLGILFDDLNPHAAVFKLFRQIIADTPAAAENGALRLVCDDTQVFQQDGQGIGKSGYKDPVTLPKDEISVGRYGFAFA